MKLITFTTAVLLLLMQFNSRAQQTRIDDALGSEDTFYLGLKAGVPYLAGLDAGYLIADQKRVKFYVNFSLQTIILLNSANVGAGYFLGRKGFSIGLRYSAYAHILDSAISEASNGTIISPELGWYKAVGKSKNTIISFQLGAAGLNFSIGARIF